MQTSVRTLVDNLAFAEAPRWHDDKLYFVDMHAGLVMTADMQGRTTVVAEVAEQPSGLGWTPDGQLLIVSMKDRRLLRLGRNGLESVADLSKLASWHCNDMVVDRLGRAYIGNFGFDLDNDADHCNAVIIRVDPNGAAQVVADEMLFPNGSVITPDGRTLIVGESFALRLTAFDIAPDGGLGNRREWARLDGAVPDGICLDAEGAIWVASPISNEVLRVHEGGEVSQRVACGRGAFACMLGGPTRRTLFICTADAHKPIDTKARRTGRIEMIEVAVPGAGLP